MVESLLSLFNILLIMLIVLAVIVVELKDLLYATIIAGFYSVIIAVLYFMLQAPDIALTQVVVGVGLQTAILIITISKTLRVEEASNRGSYPLKIVTLTFIALLLIVSALAITYDFPAFGEPIQRVGQYYVENVFEALTEPGEWYLDRKSGRLYYAPMPGEEIENSEIIAPKLEYLIKMLSLIHI